MPTVADYKTDKEEKKKKKEKLKKPCPQCHGNGKVGGEDCPRCNGTGHISASRQREELPDDSRSDDEESDFSQIANQAQWTGENVQHRNGLLKPLSRVPVV